MSEVPMFKVGRWISAPPDTRNPVCAFHEGLCCYADDDPSRCPLCHVTWVQILTSGRHRSERPSAWGQLHRADRVALARNLRAEAAKKSDCGTLRVERDAEAIEMPQEAQSPLRAAA